MTLLKTTWSNGYDPLLFQHWDAGSTPGVVSKKLYIYYLTKYTTKKNYHSLYYEELIINDFLR